MAKTYTFNEAQRLLGVDPKTFRRWLEKAEIDADKQVSKLDERVRYLTEAQLHKLAKDHGRDITANAWVKEAEQQDQGLPGKVKLLTERFDKLDSLYTSFELHYDSLESRVKDQEKEIAELKARIAALESKPKPGRKRNPQGEDQAAQAD